MRSLALREKGRLRAGGTVRLEEGVWRRTVGTAQGCTEKAGRDALLKITCVPAGASIWPDL